MRIGIIGTGKVGGNLGVTLSKSGHDVTFGVRKGKDVSALLEKCNDAKAASVQEAAAADVVFLAVPGNAILDAVDGLDLAGRILVDCTNPVGWDSGPTWQPPAEGSNAAALAAKSGARVVKAFNTFGAEFHLDPRGATVFLAGDDDQAKAAVAALGEKAGFAVVDAGPIRNAAVLENVAILWIHLAMAGGQGRDFALNLSRV